MSQITDVQTYSLELPLNDAFETAKGRKTSSPAVIVELTLSNGISGLGSATPVKYVTHEDTTSVLSAIELCAPELQGMDASAYRSVFDALAEMLPVEHSARAALEMAVLDAFCKLHGLPMCVFFGGSLSEVRTDVTIPIVAPETARELAQEAASSGFEHLKIKVGGDPDEDFARVLAVSEGAPNCGIRLDANQGFTAAVAVRFVSQLQKASVKIDMLEQPVDRDDLAALHYVTEHTSIPVFADESAVIPSDALKLVELGAVDGINVKLMKSGISGALDIIALCKVARKELMLGSMIETGIGLSTAVHFACGTGAFSRLDLDSHLLAAEQPFPGGFTSDGPILRADNEAAGHGSAPAAAHAPAVS